MSSLRKAVLEQIAREQFTTKTLELLFTSANEGIGLYFTRETINEKFVIEMNQDDVPFCEFCGLEFSKEMELCPVCKNTVQVVEDSNKLLWYFWQYSEESTLNVDGMHEENCLVVLVDNMKDIVKELPIKFNYNVGKIFNVEKQKIES